jgi:hypothetical protein
MKRIEVWAAVLFVGAMVAVDNLLTGRLIQKEAWVVVVSLGLFGGGLLALGAAIVAAWRERARVTAASLDLETVTATGARGLRWAALAAVMFSVLVFANCSGSVSSASGTRGAMFDASGYWPLAAAVLLPLIVALALPGLLATMARRHAGWWGTAAVLSIASIVVIVPATMAVAFYAGISACYFATSEGACAAGTGGVGNLFSLASIALLLPYVQMLNSRPPNEVS